MTAFFVEDDVSYPAAVAAAPRDVIRNCLCICRLYKVLYANMHKALYVNC